MTRMLITGNNTQDGAVVWRAASGGWTPQIANAAVYATGQSLAEALDAARNEEAVGQIIAVYEVAIETVGDGLVPSRLRERIRAYGPTIAVT